MDKYETRYRDIVHCFIFSSKQIKIHILEKQNQSAHFFQNGTVVAMEREDIMEFVS